MIRASVVQCFTFALVGIVGCGHFHVTAVSESSCGGKDPKGIPFYLPKPLLIISKNFQYIEESTIGLTDSAPIPKGFDNQASYASLNMAASFSRVEADKPTGAVTITENTGPVNIQAGDATNSPPRQHSGGAPVSPTPDQVKSLTKPFFTYQIVFIPDLTQKHYLRIKGGPGEVRATMNLVNGWMFTGLGPFYMKDSSTAQNILSTGIAANLTASGAADIINSVANLSKAFNQGAPGGSPRRLTEMFGTLLEKTKTEYVPKETETVQAEIHVFEPIISGDGGTAWREINLSATHFEGTILGLNHLQEIPRDKALHEKIMQQMGREQDADIEIRKIQAKEEATAREQFRLQAMKAVTPPSDGEVEKAAALQTLAPTPPKARCRLLDWLCCKRPQIVNKEASGPTSVSVP